jgi:hypothetical protein
VDSGIDIDCLEMSVNLHGFDGYLIVSTESLQPDRMRRMIFNLDTVAANRALLGIR